MLPLPLKTRRLWQMCMSNLYVFRAEHSSGENTGFLGFRGIEQPIFQAMCQLSSSSHPTHGPGNRGLYLQFMKFPVFPEIELQLLFHSYTHPQHLLSSLCVLGRDTQSKWGCVHWWLQKWVTANSEIFYLEMATHLNIPVRQRHAAREAEHNTHQSLKMDSHPTCWGTCPPHGLLVRHWPQQTSQTEVV